MTQYIEFIGNHPVLFLSFIGVLSLIIATEVRRKMRGIADIGPMEATRLVNQEDAVVVDTREEGEYRQGHIINAMHIPLSDFGRRADELDKYKDRPVIAYCRSGGRSGAAGGVLKKRGFENVYNLGGGIMAWQNANLPVTTK